MMRTDSLITKRHWYNIGFEVDSSAVIIMIMGFFLARVNILNKLTPFGFAFLASYLIMKNLNIHLLIAVIVGTLSLQGIKGISYISSYILIYTFFTVFKKEKTYSLLKAAVVSAFIFTGFRSLGILFSNTIFIYDLFMIIFEGVVVFTMIYIFSFSIPIEEIRGANLNNEKMICSFITLALTLAGIKNISVMGVEVKNLVCIAVILHLSYNYGAFLGGTIGIILGMVTYISHPEMPFIIGIFGITGLLAGIFKDLGIFGSVLGFFLGNGIISFYINGLGTSFLNFKEIILASLFFLITAEKMNFEISELLTVDFDLKKEYAEKKDEVVVKKLNRMSELFNNLSSTFKESAEEKDFYFTNEVYSMVDGIANNICTNCSKYEECWEKNYYKSYQNFFNLVGLVEMNGIDNEMVYSEANSFCIRGREIIETIDRAVERSTLNYNWQLRLRESRILLSEQLEGISKAIEDMTANLYTNSTFNKEIEEGLYKDLKNNRIDIKDISVLQMGEEDFEIYIDLNTPMDVNNRLETIISQSLGFSVASDTSFNSISSRKQRFKLLKSNRFSAITKMATMGNSENKISGDNFTFGEIDNIHYSALSDGMGIGRKANEESKVAISLLEKLMEANIDKDIILKTINSVLRTKSNDEIFTTLDLSFIDLYLGKLQMIKSGAPATFIKKRDRVEIINSRTLPVGILKEIDFNLYEEYIEDGDIIIMVSDGVLDANRYIDNSEAWLKDIITKIDSINPQVIANEIIKEASNVVLNTRDDMTVLVTKVWKNI
ncbi:stage II sporulation protein E [Tissierella praeacuta]|uniref:Stage II sporulation protein E n=1 Tax=Tissierella praeacuta DSM 18095 TaxID=1123404 RepID=A0A1M4UP28_9FIRM|nr:stage II sporulation protein E [Tissierella praeacuta]MBU5257277.1 stage II sporulation protein E [Tissierella praeacuta]TCU68890.1 stage II sporulation protein E [Tissierella praeacuta]SHE58407.1 stage II sporulation protein E [Tissierella praeacuta DSM 18095]SUP03489.1 Stage II sporulation protein E [Tissierella praeacuta]